MEPGFADVAASKSDQSEMSNLQSNNPGRDVQRVGTAEFLGEDVTKIHDPVWGVLGNLGDSQCYLGVQEKVAVVHAAMSRAHCEGQSSRSIDCPRIHLGRIRRSAERDTGDAIFFSRS